MTSLYVVPALTVERSIVQALLPERCQSSYSYMAPIIILHMHSTVSTLVVPARISTAIKLCIP
jgi:hypothetical protein